MGSVLSLDCLSCLSSPTLPFLVISPHHWSIGFFFKQHILKLSNKNCIYLWCIINCFEISIPCGMAKSSQPFVFQY
jgi:hypothetical protein